MKIVEIRMPRVFLLRNAYLKNSIKFLSELTRLKGKKIYILLYDLIDLTQSERIVLSAQVEKSLTLRGNEIFIRGGLPKDRRIRNIFLQSVGWLHMDKPISISKERDLEKNKIIPPQLISNIVRDLRKLGFKDYFFPFSEFLTELIGNAAEHGVENKNINWWMRHNVDRKGKVATYTFVDMGTGIINSHKKAGLPWKYMFLPDNKVVLDALYGKLGSSTKEKNRGKGLPQLRDVIEKELISDLILITNTVNLHYTDGKFLVGTNPDFVGTYFSWTINEKNYEKWKNSKLA